MLESVTEAMDFTKKANNLIAYQAFSECKSLVVSISNKNITAERKMILLNELEFLLNKFTNKPEFRAVEGYMERLKIHITESVSQINHRAEMNKKFPVTIIDNNDVPNVVHYVWIGGELPEKDLKNISAIKRQNTKLTVKVHYDPNALLAGELKRRMQAYVNDNLSVFDDPMYEMIKLEKIFSDYCDEQNTDLDDNIRKNFMIEVLGSDESELNATHEKVKKYWNDFSSNNPELHPPVSIENLFNTTELSQMEKAYKYELKHRSLSGASDVARVSILHTLGGLYADVGLIKINTNNDDNVLYDYMNSISNRGDFSLKQIVILLKDIYLRSVNNNFIVAPPHSTLTAFMVQEMSQAYSKILDNEVELKRIKYRNNPTFDQYSTSVVPLSQFYLEHKDGVFGAYNNEHELDSKASWKSPDNTAVEYIVFITDTSKLTQEQKNQFIHDIEANIDGYNNDTHKIVVLDSNTVIEPKNQDVIKHRNPFFTVQSLPALTKVTTDYKALFSRSSEIFVHDQDNNFKHMLQGLNLEADVVQHKNPNEFNETVAQVTSKRYFQVFLFEDRQDFDEAMKHLAPNISKENYVALVYDKATRTYSAIEPYKKLKVVRDAPLKVNFIGDIKDLSEVSKLKHRTDSVKQELHQKVDFEHVKEVRVVLSKEITPKQDLSKIKTTFSSDIGFGDNNTVCITAKDQGNKSNTTILLNNKKNVAMIRGNQTLTWSTPLERIRNIIASKAKFTSDQDSLRKYHNVIIQDRDLHTDIFKVATDVQFKGELTIVQVVDNEFRTIYGKNISEIVKDVRIIYPRYRINKMSKNLDFIDKKFKHTSIKDVSFFIKKLTPERQNTMLSTVARISRKYKDVAFNVYDDTTSKKRIIYNYKYKHGAPSIPTDPTGVSRKYNIIFQLHSNPDIDNVANLLAAKNPNTSYIAQMDDRGEIKIYDLYGNNVDIRVRGKYLIQVVDAEPIIASMSGSDLFTGIKNLQTQLRIDPNEEGSIALIAYESGRTPVTRDFVNLTNSIQELVHNDGQKVSVTAHNFEIRANEGTGTIVASNQEIHLAETTPHKNTPLQNWDTLFGLGLGGRDWLNWV
jgi:hypothetical protein